MDDKFDKGLANRIREVFEDYQHPPADEGWTQLRKKFPAKEKNNKIAWLWWSSVAAVFLVFLIMGLWLLNPEKPVKNIANDDTAKSTHKNSVAANNKANTTVTDNNIALQKTAKQKPADQTKKQQATDTLQNNKYNNSLAKSYSRAKPQLENLNPTVSATVHYRRTKTVTEKVPMAIAGIPKTLPNSQGIISNQNTEPQIAKNNQSVVVDNSNNTIKSEVQPQKNIVDLMKVEKGTAIAKKETTNKQDSKKVNFSIYAATYLNYAQGSANQINAGAGFTSDIKLSKNIKLSTGVSLAQNTLRYDNAPPGNSTHIFSSAPANAAIRKDNTFVTANALSVPEFKKYNASLVGLDIPINIKYEFNPQKNDIYILAGLSSGTFINERYTYSYQYKGNNAGTNLVPPPDETTSKSFNSFYFGKTLNFSFGIGYPLGKSNRLIIEPFLKYPLAGLGAQQIHFGAGGLNLKINFKASKK